MAEWFSIKSPGRRGTVISLKRVIIMKCKYRKKGVAVNTIRGPFA